MNIENYFASDEFYKAIFPLHNIFKNKSCNDVITVIEYIVGSGIQHAVLLGEEGNLSTEKLNDFISNMSMFISKNDFYVNSMENDFKLSEYRSNLFINDLLNKFNLSKGDLNNPEINDFVHNHIARQFRGYNFLFHAFNGSSFESIIENGINPNVNFTQQEEIDEIDAIFRKNGIKNIFGWRKINCEGNVSYSRTPSVSYYYGANSPEWFSQFTGQATSYDPELFDKSAYATNDRNAAWNNIYKLMEKNNFSREDMLTVLRFFNKNWEIYAGKSPCLAIVPDEFSDTRVQKFLSFFSEEKNSLALDDFLRICMHDSRVDCQTSDTINVQNATFVQLPKYSDIRIAFINYANLKEQEEREILDKFEILSNSKIRIINEGNEEKWVSDNSPEEVVKVKEILRDEKVFQTILSGRFKEKFILNSWLGLFDKSIYDNPENVKLFALKKPYHFACIPEEKRNDIELMRECANQEGVSSALCCYVGDDVQNDFQFFSNLINNSNVLEFYRNSYDDTETNLTYNNSIGLDVRTNPEFWKLLNKRIENINNKSLRAFPLFSVEKELEIAEREKSVGSSYK